jgi:holo-[acyl-carrier protein] synthase
MNKDIGVGIDIVDVEQFRCIPFKSKSGFYRKIFNPSEIKYCLRYKNPYEHFAGKFAIKEAVKKSIPDKVTMLDIETHHVRAKPEIRLKKRLRTKYSFSVSVSHEKNLAIAVVISSVLKRGR